MRCALLSREVVLLAGACSTFWVLSCSDSGEHERIGTATGAVINGTATNPFTTGHVIVGQVGGGTGSGTLLTRTWALSAGHVLRKATCREQSPPGRGNTRDRCYFDPGMHYVQLGNEGDPLAENKRADRISVHPGFVPRDTDAPPSGIDVALLHVEEGFPFATTAPLPRTILPQSTSALRGTQVTVFGYGENTLGGGSGTLRQGTVLVSDVSPVTHFIDIVPLFGQMPFSGDSGGPYLQGEAVVGVHRGRAPTATFPPTLSIGVAAAGFELWARLIMTSLSDFNVQIDLDGVPDSMMLRRGIMVPGSTTPAIVVTILLSSTGQSYDVPIAVDPGGGPAPFAFAAGDFNGDGLADPVASITGALFYGQTVGNIPGTLLTRTFPAQPDPTDYVSFAVGDFNGDTIDDLEATDDDGIVHVYYGSDVGLTAGLRPGKFTSTWPTSSRRDGRFALITGTRERTFPQPLFSGLAYVPAEEVGSVTDIAVEVFDAPWGTGYDFGSGEVCYRLYGDAQCQTRGSDLGDVPPDPARLITQMSSTSPAFSENEWGTLYAGVRRDDIARTFSRALCYRVEAFMGPCGGQAVEGGPNRSANAFKVRFVSGAANAVMLVDRGSAYWGRNFPSSDFLTDYDGTWETLVEPGPETTRFTLFDADADRADDEDQPGLEIQSLMFYELFHYDLQSGRGAKIGENQNPSGDYYEALNHFDIEPCDPQQNAGCTPDAPGRNVFTIAAGAHPFVEWAWQDILNANMFYSDMQGSVMRRLTKPVHVQVSSATAPVVWTSAPDGEIAPLLPIALGKLAACPGHPGKSGLVTTVREARRILQKGAGNGSSKHELEAQLLAAKLNVERAQALGEPLSSAVLYGTDLPVAAAIAQADAVLAGHCPPSGTPSDDDVATITARLRAINAGRIVY
jgi:hypothetical protein